MVHFSSVNACRFRYQVSQLYGASQTSDDWVGAVTSTLSIRVKRDRLMQDSLLTLQHVRLSTSSQCHSEQFMFNVGVMEKFT